MLAASLELADEQGLSAVTMQAVADRLGVTSMALYRHVANKADLLDGVVERILWEVPLPDPALPWASGSPCWPAAPVPPLCATPRSSPSSCSAPPPRRGPAGHGTRSTAHCTMPASTTTTPCSWSGFSPPPCSGSRPARREGGSPPIRPRQLDADFQLLQDTLAVAVVRAIEHATAP